jgi:hypothetical protein
LFDRCKWGCKAKPNRSNDNRKRQLGFEPFRRSDQIVCRDTVPILGVIGEQNVVGGELTISVGARSDPDSIDEPRVFQIKKVTLLPALTPAAGIRQQRVIRLVFGLMNATSFCRGRPEAKAIAYARLGCDAAAPRRSPVPAERGRFAVAGAIPPAPHSRRIGRPVPL